MHASRKTVAILAGLQALLFTGNSVGIAIHGLAGLALAENKALATLPVTGVGWNFLYIGGTTLLTETYAPAEKAKAQGANDLAIFLVMAVSSSASGVLLHSNGWEILNYLALPFVAAVVVALLWLSARRSLGVRAA